MGSVTSTTESFQFTIPNYSIEHQGGAILDVTLDYTYKPDLGNPELYFEFQQVANYIDNFFKNYPNETDYWEVLNKNLSKQLSSDTIHRDFGFSGLDYKLSDSLTDLTTTLAVQQGSGDVPYPRSTIVANNLATEPSERFRFTIPDYAVEHQGDATLDVTLDYQYRPAAKGYPNPYFEFQQVAHFVEDFFQRYPNETDPWEVVNTQLASALTTEVVSKDFGFTGVDYDLPELIDALTTTLAVTKGSGNVPYARTSTVSTTLDPGSVLDAVIATVQRNNNLPLLDLRRFETDQQLEASLRIDRPLEGAIVAGFYKVEDLRGSVRDPISGELVLPGEAQYRDVALAGSNRMPNLDYLRIDGTSNSNRPVTVNGGALLAPFAIVPFGNTVFAWPAANANDRAGFETDGLNLLQLNDPEQCGDPGCRPLQLEFSWSMA